MDPKPTSAAPSPLKLLTTKGHLFVPSNRGKERFNVAAINPGLHCLPDDRYCHFSDHHDPVGTKRRLLVESAPLDY